MAIRIAGADPDEPFAYVDVIASGLQFNQVQFSNPAATGFESDNHSVADGVNQPPSGDVLVGSVPLDTPEPASSILMGLGVGTIMLMAIRKCLFSVSSASRQQSTLVTAWQRHALYLFRVATQPAKSLFALKKMATLPLVDDRTSKIP
jgi:hypothetical protein